MSFVFTQQDLPQLPVKASEVPSVIGSSEMSVVLEGWMESDVLQSWKVRGALLALFCFRI